MGVFDVFQIPYSAVEREHEAAISKAAGAGAGIVIRGGAAKGAPAEGKRTGLQWERWQRAHIDDLLDGATPVEFILRFTFSHPDMIQPLSVPSIRRISRATSTLCARGRCHQLFTQKRSAASPTPALRLKRPRVAQGFSRRRPKDRIAASLQSRRHRFREWSAQPVRQGSAIDGMSDCAAAGIHAVRGRNAIT